MSIKCLCDQTVGYTCESCEFERLEASIKNLQTENAKLRECIEFYADLDNEVDFYDSRGMSYARQVLKELYKGETK